MPARIEDQANLSARHRIRVIRTSLFRDLGLSQAAAVKERRQAGQGHDDRQVAQK